MNARLVTPPQLFLIAGTRVALGAGIGLLLADRFDDDQRRAVGWTLLGLGALSTIPLALRVFRTPAAPQAIGAPALRPQRAIAPAVGL